MSALTPSPTMSELEADRVLSTDPRAVEAIVAKADHLLIAEDHSAASAYYRKALGLLSQSGRGSTALAGRVSDTIAWLNGQFVHHLVSGLQEHGFGQNDWHPRFATALAMMAGQIERPPENRQYPQIPMSFYYPGTDYVEFADPSAFDWAELVEANTSTIKAEADALLGQSGGFTAYVKKADDRPQGDVHGMLENEDWSSFDLTDKGEFTAERTQHCPQTIKTLKDHVPLCVIPGRAPTPIFSLLAAGKRIPPHTGMINTRLICHLPLIVPGEGRLRVGAQARQWEEGKLLIFDDSVEHEAWNNAEQDRLVLIFDVWRPELEQAERDQIATLFAVVNAY